MIKKKIKPSTPVDYDASKNTCTSDSDEIHFKEASPGIKLDWSTAKLDLKLNKKFKVVNEDNEETGIKYVDDDDNEKYSSEPIKDNAEKCKKHLIDSGLDTLFKVVVANGHTIQIDIDREDDLKVYKKNYDIIKEFLGTHEVIETLSKSNKLHITIKTKNIFNAMTRIAIQCILGSDLLREAMNFRNYKRGYKNPILFIETINENKEKGA